MDGCFVLDYAVNVVLERAIRRETPDPANHLGKYPQGCAICTENPVIYNIKDLMEVQAAHVDIGSIVHEIEYHAKLNQEVRLSRALNHDVMLNVMQYFLSMKMPVIASLIVRSKILHVIEVRLVSLYFEALVG